MVREQVAGAGQAEEPGARRSRAGSVHPVLDVRCPGGLSLGSRGGHDNAREFAAGSASGLVRHFFDDEPVPGTRGVSHALLGQIEPFRTAELVPYDTAFLSGFIVEHYQIVLLDAAQASQDAMTRKLEEMCAAEIPGDTYRNLQMHPVFSGQTFKHILVPVWLLSYLYGTKTYQVVVNGYDGRMAGQYPKSPWKIAFLVLLAIIVFMIFVLLNQNN